MRHARSRLGLALALSSLVAFPVASQDSAKDSGGSLGVVRKLLRWDEPAEPARLLGPIHFVGTQGLGAFLITGSEGHVLVYTGMPGSGPMIEESIRKLGFEPRDVEFVLTGHAHCDHVGGHAYLAQATGARIAMMREEVELFASGGKADFHYGAQADFAFEPVAVDRVLRDGEELRLGEIAITAHRTAGHTRGSTTYVTKVVADEKTYTVVFPDGTSVNPGYRLVRDPSYPGIGDDYRRTFDVLETLRPDAWFTAHNEFYGLEAKLARAVEEGPAAWIDPEGYAKFVAAQKKKFEAAVAREQAAESALGK